MATPYDFLNKPVTTANSTPMYPNLAPQAPSMEFPVMAGASINPVQQSAPVVAPKPVAPTIASTYKAPQAMTATIQTPVVSTPTGTPIYEGGSATAGLKPDGTPQDPIGYRDAYGKTVFSTPTQAPGTALGVTGTMNDVYGEAANFYGDREGWLVGKGVSETAEKANLAAEMQRQIDASNALYARKLREAKIQGEARLGATRAGELSRGTIGGNVATAAIDQTSNVNNEIYNDIEQERAMAEAAVRAGIDEKAKKYYEDKRAALESGFKDRIAFQKNFGEYSKTQAVDFVNTLMASGANPDSVTEADAKAMGTTLKDIKNAFLLKKYEEKQAEKKRTQDLADKLAAKGLENIPEGNISMQYDPVTGTYKKVAYNPKTYKAEVGTMGIGGVGGLNVSPQAQNYIKLIDSGEMTLDDALIRVGSSKAGLALKNEIVAGMAQSGGRSAKAVEKVRDTKRLVDEVLNSDMEYFGTSIAPRFRAINPYYASFQTKLDSLVAALTSENTGLLKGPMSDKDIQFLKDLSSGLDIAMDEETAQKRLVQIQTRLAEKLAPFDSDAGGQSSGVIFSPDGSQQINVSELTPAELQEAKAAGWK